MKTTSSERPISRNNTPGAKSTLAVLALTSSFLLSSLSASATPDTPRFRHVGQQTESSRTVRELPARIPVETNNSEHTQPYDSLLPRSVEQILAELPASYPYMKYAVRAAGPWVISGYRPLPERVFSLPEASFRSILGRRATTFGNPVPIYKEVEDSIVETLPSPASSPNGLYFGEEETSDSSNLNTEREIAGYDYEFIYMDDVENLNIPPIAQGEYMPGWLREALIDERIQDDMMYRIMMKNPHAIEYARWDLPEPPRLPEDDPTFVGFLRKLNLPDIDPSQASIQESSLGRRNWLHVVNTGLQFSQTYFSRNWYQGGTNHVSLLFNFLWDVSLNQVYHPNLMLQSVVSYKLGLNTTPRGSLHKYQISADAFQWNFKTGLKAFTNWYYSFNSQFKTQMLTNYLSDSENRSASFLSPGEFNMGLGMTYNFTNKKNTFKLSLSISPISYNLKTCIDKEIDPTQFKITPPAKTVSEIGSNVEMNYEWNLLSNVVWRSRIFVFSDYSSLMGDWENTFDFAINRFLSTQFYFHLRYDSSTPTYFQTGWGKWQFKEFLSFGLSYTFSTKP